MSRAIEELKEYQKERKFPQSVGMTTPSTELERTLQELGIQNLSKNQESLDQFRSVIASTVFQLEKSLYRLQDEFVRKNRHINTLIEAVLELSGEDAEIPPDPMDDISSS